MFYGLKYSFMQEKFFHSHSFFKNFEFLIYILKSFFF